jgi:hypothetical protein
VITSPDVPFYTGKENIPESLEEDLGKGLDLVKMIQETKQGPNRSFNSHLEDGTGLYSKDNRAHDPGDSKGSVVNQVAASHHPRIHSPLNEESPELDLVKNSFKGNSSQDPVTPNRHVPSKILADKQDLNMPYFSVSPKPKIPPSIMKKMSISRSKSVTDKNSKSITSSRPHAPSIVSHFFQTNKTQTGELNKTINNLNNKSENKKSV